MRRLLRIINEVSLGWMLAGLGGVIFVFAIVYWMLQFTGAGLEFTAAPHQAITFWDSLYFSLVTISSLGYGDLHPVGVSRLFVGAEVVLGLAFFGVIVAKISSAKQDYILRRLYSEKVEDQVKRYAENLDEGRELYRITSGLLLSGEIEPSQTTTFQGSVEEVTLFYQLHQLASSMSETMAFEARNNTLFGDVADSAIARLYAGWQDALSYTMELWDDHREAACDLVFRGNSRQLALMLEPVLEIARLGLRDSRNPDIRKQCEELIDLAKHIQNLVIPDVIRHEQADAAAIPRKATE